MLRDFIGESEGGLFIPDGERHYAQPAEYRYHALRRFRESVLRVVNDGDIVINFWTGHADSEVCSRLGMQLLENLAFRQEWARKPIRVSGLTIIKASFQLQNRDQRMREKRGESFNRLGWDGLS